MCETWNRLPKEIAAGWNLRLVGPWREDEGGGGNSFKEKLVQTIKQGSNQIALCEPIFDRSKLKEVMMRASYFVYPSMAKERHLNISLGAELAVFQSSLLDALKILLIMRLRVLYFRRQQGKQ